MAMRSFTANSNPITLTADPALTALALINSQQPQCPCGRGPNESHAHGIGTGGVFVINAPR